MDSYSIIRFYQQQDEEVVDTGLSLEDAQEHCNDDDTSSSTCTTEEGELRTEECGPWFEGFREED